MAGGASLSEAGEDRRALYLRWRPVSFEDVVGQEHVVRTLRNAVRSGRPAHAYLFAGPRGTGKTSLARILYRAVNCTDSRGRDPCGECPACRAALDGRALDLIEIDAASNRGIDDVRDLRERVAFSPADVRFRVYIVDEAHELTAPAWDAFLKTLEEPPPRSVILLIGTSPDRQLLTILSRCQVVRFAPLPEPLVAERLRAQGVEDAALVGRLARLSGGSPGQARALADPALWEFRRSFLQKLSATPMDSVGLAKAWSEFVEEAGKESGAQRRRAALVLRLLIECFNEALQLQMGVPPRLADPADPRRMRASP